jgi:glycosyltransferase involved in cell wall biosynthesis
MNNTKDREQAVNSLPPLPQRPLVSIVTPSYNTGPFIEETLRSVQIQDYPLIEHIVLDSGSTDGTLEILARYPSVRLISPAPQGMCEKVNLGFSIAKGDIVAWQCADDYYLPGVVTKAVQALQDNPQVALVYSNDLRVDENSVEILRTRSKHVDFDDLVQELDWVPQQTAFFRREALERVGPLDSTYPLVADWDLWIRISKLFPVLHVDEWWGAFRVRTGQRSDVHKYEAWKQGRRMTRRKHGGRFFSPLFRNYWGAKFSRALTMLRTSQFRVFFAKLSSVLRGFASR